MSDPKNKGRCLMDDLKTIVESLIRIESKQIKDDSPWFAVNDGADYLKCSPRSLRRYIQDGKIKSYHTPTGGVRLHRSDLDAFVMFGKPYKKLTRPQKEQINETKNV